MSKLIALEGIDGCGKTTQINLVTEALRKRGLKVKTHAFYSRETPVGDLIEKILSGVESVNKGTLQLLLEADRYEKQDELKLWLKEYDIVILDRYTTSGLAYGIANNLNFSWCRSLQKGMIKPFDILLDMHHNAAIARKGSEVESIYDSDAIFLQMVREAYTSLVPIGQRIDAYRSKEDVTKDIVVLITLAPHTSL